MFYTVYTIAYCESAALDLCVQATKDIYSQFFTHPF